jgi:hypothetical protein
MATPVNFPEPTASRNKVGCGMNPANLAASLLAAPRGLAHAGLDEVLALAQNVLRVALRFNLQLDMEPVPEVGVFGSRGYGLSEESSDLNMFAVLPDNSWYAARSVRVKVTELLEWAMACGGLEAVKLDELRESVSWKDLGTGFRLRGFADSNLDPQQQLTRSI